MNGPDRDSWVSPGSEKERKIDNMLAIFYTTGSGIPDHFHGCVGAW